MADLELNVATQRDVIFNALSSRGFRAVEHEQLKKLINFEGAQAKEGPMLLSGIPKSIKRVEIPYHNGTTSIVVPDSVEIFTSVAGRHASGVYVSKQLDGKDYIFIKPSIFKAMPTWAIAELSEVKKVAK